MKDPTEPVQPVEHIKPINQPDWAVMPDEDWDDGPWDDNVRWV